MLHKKDLLTAVSLLMALLLKSSGQEVHQNFLSRLQMPAANEACLPNEDLHTNNKLECVLSCQRVNPLQNPTGFTFLQDGRCYCQSLPSGVVPGYEVGAYIPAYQNIIPDLYFDMECTVGGQLIGSIAGQLINGASLTEGRVGKALHTDGSSQYVDFGNHRDKCVANLELCPIGITLALWLKTGISEFNEQYYISNGGQTMNSFGISLHKPGPGTSHLQVRFRLLDGRDWRIDDPEAALDGVWQHIVMTWKEDIGSKLYIDGVLNVETATPDQSGAAETHDNFYLGRPNNVDDCYGLAWYDELKVYYEYMEANFVENLP